MIIENLLFFLYKVLFDILISFDSFVFLSKKAI